MNEEIRTEEYRYLHDEHLKNREYVFERPLLIISVVIIATHYLIQNQIFESGSDLSQSIQKLTGFLFLILVLYYNLAFISQRIGSDAQIVAYIQLFHEGDLAPAWIGWENSLRCYRKWKKANSKNIPSFLKIATKDDHIYTHGWFYRFIYNFHLVLIFALFIILLITAHSINNILVGFLIITGLYVSLSKDSYSLYSMHHSKSGRLLEEERAIWCAVCKKCFFSEVKIDIDSLIKDNRLIIDTEEKT